MSLALPDGAAVAAAAARIAGVAHRTPVLTSRRINDALGLSLYFKCENLQRAGAFKFRGAYNALAQLDPAARARGVVAFSSGNHAQATALAGSLLGIPTTIVMPTDAPAVKLTATRGYGANVELYERHVHDREDIAREIAGRTGAMTLPPFDHPDIIAGQGTAARELLQDAPDLDVVIAPLGGGGLLSGSALAAHTQHRDIEVYGAEPAAGDDGKQSFDSGVRVRIDVPRTLADGAQTQQLGELTFAIIQREVRDIVLVSDAELRSAMAELASTMKLVVEPTGALAYAAARTLAPSLAGRSVGVIISGGNIDLTRFADLIAHPEGPIQE